MTDTATRPLPSAVPPTEAEAAAWRALSREEQLARYREVLLAPEAGTVSDVTMADIVAARASVLPPGVAEFRLSRRAARDLIGIYDHTEAISAPIRLMPTMPGWNARSTCSRTSP